MPPTLELILTKYFLSAYYSGQVSAVLTLATVTLEWQKVLLIASRHEAVIAKFCELRHCRSPLTFVSNLCKRQLPPDN